MSSSTSYFQQSKWNYEVEISLVNQNEDIASNLVKRTKGTLIHRITAKRLIEDLENKERETRNKIRDTRDQDVRDLEEEIVELSINYNITSKFASFVAIEERKAEDKVFISADGLALREVLVPRASHESASSDLYFETHAAPAFGSGSRVLSSFRGAMFASEAEDSGSVSSILLLDVTPATLGIEGLGGSFLPVILRNNLIPTKRQAIHRATVTKEHGRLPFVRVNVFEGECELATDCKPLGTVELESSKWTDAIVELLVTFELDVNGILTVTVQVNTTRQYPSH